MKRLISVWFLLLLCASAAVSADFTALAPQGYVSDFAGVVDPAARARLERYAAAVQRSTGAEMAIVTLPTLGGEPIEDVSNAIFRKWGVGAKGKNEGIMLLLVIQDRRSRLEVGYGLEPIIPDGFGGSILRAMRPYLRENRYAAALEEAAAQIGSRIAEAKNVSIDEAPAPRPQRRPERGIPVSGLLLFGGILLFLLLSGLSGGGRGGRGGRGGFGGRGGDVLTGMLIGHLLGGAGRSFGGRHGGGFGGFDSGGGFGGFGGGDSGGGGASSDW